MCDFMVDLIPSCFTIPFFLWSVDHRQHNKVSKQLPVIKKNSSRKNLQRQVPLLIKHTTKENSYNWGNNEYPHVFAKTNSQLVGFEHCDNMRDHISPYLIWLPSGSTWHFFSISLKKLANYREVRLIPTYWPLTNSEAISFELCLKHLSLTSCYASHLLLTQWIKFLLYFRHQTHRLVLATFVTSAPDKHLCKHLGLFSARGQHVGSTHANFDSAPHNS